MPEAMRMIPFVSAGLVIGMAVCLIPPVCAETTPANDNQRAPFLSVYRWDVGGLAKGEHDVYAAWLNRSSVWPESHQPKDTWDNIEGANWLLKPWSEWMGAHPGNRFILSVSLLAGPWDGSGPKTGIDAGIPVSLEEGAIIHVIRAEVR